MNVPETISHTNAPAQLAVPGMAPEQPKAPAPGMIPEQPGRSPDETAGVAARVKALVLEELNERKSRFLKDPAGYASAMLEADGDGQSDAANAPQARASRHMAMQSYLARGMEGFTPRALTARDANAAHTALADPKTGGAAKLKTLLQLKESYGNLGEAAIAELELAPQIRAAVDLAVNNPRQEAFAGELLGAALAPQSDAEVMAKRLAALAGTNEPANAALAVLLADHGKEEKASPAGGPHPGPAAWQEAAAQTLAALTGDHAPLDDTNAYQVAGPAVAPPSGIPEGKTPPDSVVVPKGPTLAEQEKTDNAWIMMRGLLQGSAVEIDGMETIGWITPQQADLGRKIQVRLHGEGGAAFREGAQKLEKSLGGSAHTTLRAAAVERLLANTEAGMDAEDAVKTSIAEAKEMAGYPAAEHIAEIPAGVVHGTKTGINNTIGMAEKVVNYFETLGINPETAAKLSREEIQAILENSDDPDLKYEAIRSSVMQVMAPTLANDPNAPKTSLPRVEAGETPKTGTGKAFSKGVEVGTELAMDTALFAGGGKVTKGVEKLTKQALGIPAKITKATELASLAKSTGKPLWGKELPRRTLLENATDYYTKHYAPKINPISGESIPYSILTEKGEVTFRSTKAGLGKLRDKISDDKLRLIPFADELLKTSRHLRQEIPRHQIHEKQGMKIHIFQNVVKLDGKKYEIEFTVREASNGKFFYEMLEYPVRNSLPENVAGGAALNLAASSDNEPELNMRLTPVE